MMSKCTQLTLNNYRKALLKQTLIINSVSFPLFLKYISNLWNITNYFYSESYLILSDTLLYTCRDVLLYW